MYSKDCLGLLKVISSRMRTDVISKYYAPKPGEVKGIYKPRHSALVDNDLVKHIENKEPIGLYVLSQDFGRHGLTKIAILDIDDKKKEYSWLQLSNIGYRLSEELKKYDVKNWACRSGGGHGIHLWMLWNNSQNAKEVRELLKKVVEDSEVKCHIDIFPAQDKIGEKDLGNLIALPFARDSRPILNLLTGEVQENLAAFRMQDGILNNDLVTKSDLVMDMLIADSGRGIGKEDLGPVDLETLKDALSYIPTDNYETWRDVGLAIKQATYNGQLDEYEAEKAWEEWSRQDEKFDERTQNYNWKRFSPNGTLTLGTVWYLAEQNGWNKKSAKGIVLKPTVPIQEGEPPRWTSAETPLDIKNLNKDHFFTVDGGRAFVFREKYDESLKRRTLIRMPLADFKAVYKNKKVVAGKNKQGLPVIADLGSVWLDSVYRREYDEIVLRPEGASVKEYNLWKGFLVESNGSGSCELYKDHIFRNIANKDQKVYEYILNWLAQMIQKPHEVIGTAIVLRGEKGTGKSTFVHFIGRLLGQHYLQVTSSKAITGNFNSHLRDTILLFADEAVWAGSKQEESILKGIVTEPYLTIEGKGVNAVQCRNMIHLIVSTNNEWSIPASIDERRWLTLHIGNENKQDISFFKKLRHEMHNGGYEKLLYELLNRDISNFDAANIPETDELANQKILSMDSWMGWWMEKLETGQLYVGHQKWTDEFPGKILYYNYLEHCKESGYRNPKGFITFTKRLESLIPEIKKERKYAEKTIETTQGSVYDGQRAIMWKINSLEKCVEMFEKKTKIKVPESGVLNQESNVVDKVDKKLQDDKPIKF